MSLQIGQCVSNIFTSDERILTVNENITIDTHITATFDKVVEEVDIVQECVKHGEFLESLMNISLPFKCEPSSIAYKLEVFPNYDVDYINVSWEP